MFLEIIEEAKKVWIKNSNEKLKELTVKWNERHPNEKPRKSFKITETDAQVNLDFVYMNHNFDCINYMTF